jgi:hypothetical protein
MSEHGYLRLNCSETLLLGEENQKVLESIARKIRDFKKLKPLPEHYKEEHLRNTMPTSMSKAERDALRKTK